MNNKVYEYVLKRDGNCCQICGNSGDYWKLDLHHIDGRSPKKTDDPDNCIMLCHRCHMMVHQNMIKWRPILKEKVKVNESIAIYRIGD